MHMKMETSVSLRLFCAVIAIALGCTAGCATGGRDTVTQVATIDALLAGAFDGSMTLDTLLHYGDFGIGTFDRLDGEMVVLDGRVWQVRADGSVREPARHTTTPFAAVIRFAPDRTIPVNRALDLTGLQECINAAGLNSNLMYAIRARGIFASVKTRSVPAQDKPYPTLAEVARSQPVFTASNVTGTLVGFRLPAYVGGINVPGYHLHFLSDDRAFGGHVLECVMTVGAIEADDSHRFTMILPADDAGFGQVDLSVDRSEALHEVER